MNKQHVYHLTVEWTGNTGNGTQNYQAYERSHTVKIPNKVDIYCSSDPAFRGDKTKHNPEELLVAAIANCHMLWYLHLCAVAGVVVTSYIDRPMGVMQESQNGPDRFTQVTLNPEVEVKEPTMVAKAMALHGKVGEHCCIANSCNFPVYHKPTCTVGA